MTNPPSPARSGRHALLWSIAAWLLLGACAVRHEYLWGGEWSSVLGWLEGAGVVGFALLGGAAWLAAVARADRLTSLELWGGGALLTALAVLAPAFLSTDVFDYVARGRVEAIHGANPYVVSPSAFAARDPAMLAAGWPEFVMPYGPLTALLQWAFAWLGGDAPLIGAYLFKALFGLAHVATAVLIHHTLTITHPQTARRGAVAWLWNPFLILESANSGHNEAMMAAWMAVMAWAIVRDRFALATAAFGVAVLFKHGCAVLGPLLLALAWARRRMLGFAGGVGITAIVTAPLAWHYFSEPGALDFLSKQAAIVQTSIQKLILEVWGQHATELFRTAGAGAVLGAVAWAVVRLRHPVSFGNRGVRVTLVFLALFMAQFSPWYHLWWLPLLGLWDAPGFHRMLVVLTFCGPASYFFYAAQRSFGADHQILQWTLTLALPICVGAWPSRAPQPTDSSSGPAS